MSYSFAIKFNEGYAVPLPQDSIPSNRIEYYMEDAGYSTMDPKTLEWVSWIIQERTQYREKEIVVGIVDTFLKKSREHLSACGLSTIRHESVYCEIEFPLDVKVAVMIGKFCIIMSKKVQAEKFDIALKLSGGVSNG